jgi:hypothetical protein
LIGREVVMVCQPGNQFSFVLWLRHCP